MNKSAATIRIVLDRSAIESYAMGHMHVGEVITEVIADKAEYYAVGLPATALAEAYGRAQDEVAAARLGILASLSSTVLIDLDAENTGQVGSIIPHARGDMQRAHAAWAVLKHRALILTAEPEEAQRVVPGHRIIEIPAEDA